MSPQTFDGFSPLPLRLPIASGLSILLWLSVIACGRTIAFVD
jgi:hypothetical protein